MTERLAILGPACPTQLPDMLSTSRGQSPPELLCVSTILDNPAVRLSGGADDRTLQTDRLQQSDERDQQGGGLERCYAYMAPSQ